MPRVTVKGASAPKVELAQRTCTVLIVDDEPDILDSMAALLSKSIPNTECVTAGSAAEAWKVMDQRPVDVIISDYKMPHMDGIKFLMEARSRAPRVARMLLTAYPDVDVAVQAINEAGIETFFTKPIDPDRVVRVVALALDARRAREDRDRAIARAMAMRRAHGGA